MDEGDCLKSARIVDAQKIIGKRRATISQAPFFADFADFADRSVACMLSLILVNSLFVMTVG